MQRVTIVTNACASDDTRLEYVLRSWLRVFAHRLDKLVVIVNPVAPVGRIAALHGNDGNVQRVLHVIQHLQEQERRIRHVVLADPRSAAASLRNWFVGGVPFLCQAGTPILPFVYGMAYAEDGLVLRADCDMVFHDRGFVDHAGSLIDRGEADLVEPYRWSQTQVSQVSSRAFLFDARKFRDRCLPLRHATLDWLRSVHRFFAGRPRIMALEQSLTMEMRSGRIAHCVLPQSDGWSLHFGRRSDFTLPGIEGFIRQVEQGNMPDAQMRSGGNFEPKAWC